jgi:nucleoid DNA-binding protein
MSKSQNKTTETENSVTDFINSVEDAAKRADTFRIVELFKTQTGVEPKLWGPSIIGFGSYHYKYESGREGDAPATGFSPRKDSFAFYFASEFDQREELLTVLGKHKTGKGCVYIKKLDDVDAEVLKKMIDASVHYIKGKYS